MSETLTSKEIIDRLLEWYWPASKSDSEDEDEDESISGGDFLEDFSRLVAIRKD